MPRQRDMQWWSHVNRVANGTKWVCNYCKKTRTGRVGRIEKHLTRCPKYRPNPPNAEEVHNNITAVPSYEDEIEFVMRLVIGILGNVFWVTISPNFSISNLQSDIAKRIGLKLDEEDEKIRAEE